MTRQLEGEITQSFRKKQKHLNDFIKPANFGPKIRKEIEIINQNWVRCISSKLVDHYQTSVKNLSDHINSLALTNLEFKNLTDSAIQQAKSHFGHKITASTISKFKNVLQKLPPTANTQTLNKTATNTSPRQNKTPPHTRTIHGHKDPLSNFFPCRIQFRGHTFASLEHAFQYQKALTHDCQHLAQRIFMAPHAGIAKILAREIPSISHSWIKYRENFMRELLHIKFYSSKLFRDTLMALPERCHLTHPVPDNFWGTGRDGKGQNMLGFILSDIHRKKTTDQKRRTHTNSNKPSIPTPAPVPTNNSFTPLMDRSLSNPPPPSLSSHPRSPSTLSHSCHSTPTSPPAPTTWPSLSTIPSPSISNFSATPVRRSQSNRRTNPSPTQTKGKRTRFVSPKTSPSFPITPSRPDTNVKTNWELPPLTKPVVLLGASNLSRITHSPLRNIQVHSYPGAKFSHLTKMFTKYNRPAQPKSIFISVGLNNRSNQPTGTSVPQLRQMVNACSKTFPQSKIFLSKINYSPLLSDIEKMNLDAINNAMDSLSHTNLVIMDKLDESKFLTSSEDPIHWTSDTANEFVKHWLSYLN